MRLVRQYMTYKDSQGLIVIREFLDNPQDSQLLRDQQYWRRGTSSIPKG